MRRVDKKLARRRNCAPVRGKLFIIWLGVATLYAPSYSIEDYSGSRQRDGIAIQLLPIDFGNPESRLQLMIDKDKRNVFRIDEFSDGYWSLHFSVISKLQIQQSSRSLPFALKNICRAVRYAVLVMSKLECSGFSCGYNASTPLTYILGKRINSGFVFGVSTMSHIKMKAKTIWRHGNDW